MLTPAEKTKATTKKLNAVNNGNTINRQGMRFKNKFQTSPPLLL